MNEPGDFTDRTYDIATVDYRSSPTLRGELAIGARLFQHYRLGIQASYQATRLRTHRINESFGHPNNVIEIADPLQQWQWGISLAYT